MKPGVCVARIVLIAWVSISLGCEGGSSQTGGPIVCATSADCPSTATCIQNVCVAACNTTADCPTKTQACYDGTCHEVRQPECAADEDCVSPGDCGILDGATCSAGRCQYAAAISGTVCDDGDLCTESDACDSDGRCVGTPKVCTDPPLPQCVQGDSTLREYEPICVTQTGECGSIQHDSPCANCSTDCLDPCEGVACNDLQGGCRSSGTCFPGSPPTCAYQSTPDGQPCDASAVGSQDGTCFGGLCVECVFNEDCDATPAGLSACSSAVCMNGQCQYTIQPATVCQPQGCSTGVVSNERLCGSGGDCPDTGTSSCNGLRCNGAGTACLSMCSDESDCVAGLFCDVTGSCVGLLPDGSDCTGLGNDACASGHCDGTLCCVGGDCCNSALDCPPEYTVPSACTDPTTTTDCQGERQDPVCASNVCTSVAVPDDSGCSGLPHTCPNNFASETCSAAMDQSAPVCETACTLGNGDCDTGFVCMSGNCEAPAGVGAACTGGPGQGTCDTGLKCENGLCCDAAGATCCDSDAQCANGLKCHNAISACYETCSDYSNSRCANNNEYCLSDTCVPELAEGVACVSDGQCLSAECTEGVCCDSFCGATCASCLASLTGGTDGTCGAIEYGKHDTSGSNQCTAGGSGCSGSSCVCDGMSASSSACRRDIGQSCSNDGTCASDACECANDTCSSQKCTPVHCGECRYTTNGSNCVSGLGDGVAVDDPEDCTGSVSCYDGDCLGDPGTSCTVPGDCGENHCECGNASCSGGSKKCATLACDDCSYTTNGTSCTGDLTDGTSCTDGDACTTGDQCTNGDCGPTGSVMCNSPTGDCESSSGVCNPGDGSCSYGVLGSGSLCRGAAGDCDIPEVCNGMSPTCPSDQLYNGGTVCRTSEGPCDVAETCDGSSTQCPGDGVESAGTECRMSTAGCDPAEDCNGVNVSCPADVNNCTAGIFDDFSGNLSDWVIETCNWEISSGQLRTTTEEDDCLIRYVGSSTTTASQWGTLTIGGASGDVVGFIVRSQADGTGPRYVIAAERGQSTVDWMEFNGSLFQTTRDTQSVGATWQDGDVLGVEVTGSSDDTYVYVWRNPGPRPWGAYDIRFNEDPFSPANSGHDLGVFMYRRSDGSPWADDFNGDDI